MYWIHPINLKRQQLDAFYTLFEDLRENSIIEVTTDMFSLK